MPIVTIIFISFLFISSLKWGILVFSSTICVVNSLLQIMWRRVIYITWPHFLIDLLDSILLSILSMGSKGLRDLIPLVQRNEGFCVPSLIIHLLFFSGTIIIRNQRIMSNCSRLCWVYWWILWWMEWRMMC